MGGEATNTPEQRDFVENVHAMKRLAQPEEIAQSALYFASDASSFITGTTLFLEGGDHYTHLKSGFARNLFIARNRA